MIKLARVCVLVGVASVGHPPDVIGRSLQDEPVRLRRWHERARLIPNPGPGETYFRLRAEAQWSPEALEDRTRYAVRVTLPDGRIEQHPLRPQDGPGSRFITVLVPADAVLDLRPDAVRIEAEVIDAARSVPLSNRLRADIQHFPTPTVPGAAEAAGPFGWGRPLDSPETGARSLPGEGPDGWRFVRVVSTPEAPGFFIATTEASNEQVAGRLPDHDPNAGRSDEFLLDNPDQPAVNLTPAQARSYLEALSAADPSGVSYRLPSRSEWERAARAGRSTRFWWGDEASYPAGANFLGPEPGVPIDITNRAAGFGQPFEANPWGLIHTFGNVAEWAVASSDDPSTFIRMGGHFRTEPAEVLDPPVVEDPQSPGPDPFVGLRPVFDLDARSGADLIEQALSEERRLAGVEVSFDPDRATAILTGTVAEPADRQLADDRLRSLWFLSAVENRIETPTVPPGMLLELIEPVGPPRRTNVLGQSFDEIPVSVRWTSPLPVSGSDWWVNVYGRSGAHFAHRLGDREPGRSTVRVVVPTRLVPDEATVRVALSLGGPSPSPSRSGDRLVSPPAEITIPRPSP